MKLLMHIILQLWILLLSSAQLSADEIDTYRLATDDQISITVFNEPDLNIDKVRVSANGTISMPLLGQVTVSDLTIHELEAKLTNMFLQGYLKKPDVTVNITEYRPFYINGEVKNPGSYPYRQGLTVEKAVTIAGGFTDRASKSSISLVNEGRKEARTVRNVSINEKVKPGDIITVKESFF